MDPLFLALPVLEKARNKTPEHLGRFCSKDQIFGGWAESCDVAMKLSTVSGMNLEVICDVQDVADESYYRLNDDRVIAWVSAKVNAILAFKYPDLDVASWKKLSASGSSASIAGMSRDDKIKAMQDADRARGDKDRITFGAALVTDYLHSSWAEKLLSSLHLSLADLDTKKKSAATITEDTASSNNTAARPREGAGSDWDANKKKKVGGEIKLATGGAKAGAGKLLTKTEQFAKKGLSTKGMSSMASFFKPKAK